MPLEREIAKIEELHEIGECLLMKNLDLIYLLKNGFWVYFIKLTEIVVYKKILGIAEIEWHKLGADNVETLVRFYRKHYLI